MTRKESLAVLHTVDGGEMLPALQQRIHELQREGKRAIVITCLHSATRLYDHFDAIEGIDADAVGLIDCTGETQYDEPGDDILFIEAPSMLETILIRTEQLVRRMGSEVGIIVHSLDSLASHTDNDLVAEFAQRLLHKLEPYPVDVEFVSLAGDNANALAARIDSLVGITSGGLRGLVRALGIKKRE